MSFFINSFSFSKKIIFHQIKAYVLYSVSDVNDMNYSYCEISILRVLLFGASMRLKPFDKGNFLWYQIIVC